MIQNLVSTKHTNPDNPIHPNTNNTPTQIGWAGAPSYPGWNLSRPYLTGDFLQQPHRHTAPVPASLTHRFNSTAAAGSSGLSPQQQAPPPLGQFPLLVQERLLVEDLLWVVTGYEGRYIKVDSPSSGGATTSSMGENGGGGGGGGYQPEEAPVAFVLAGDGGVDPSLAAMARKFLPLAGYCVRVRRFIETKRRCVLTVVGGVWRWRRLNLTE